MVKREDGVNMNWLRQLSPETIEWMKYFITGIAFLFMGIEFSLDEPKSDSYTVTHRVLIRKLIHALLIFFGIVLVLGCFMEI